MRLPLCFLITGLVRSDNLPVPAPSYIEENHASVKLNDHSAWVSVGTEIATSLEVTDHADNRGMGIADRCFWTETQIRVFHGKEILEVWLNAKANLDRELLDVYKFNLRYKDIDGNDVGDVKSTEIYIIDKNDNTPSVTTPSRMHMIQEDTKPGMDFPDVNWENVKQNGIISIEDKDDPESKSNVFLAMIDISSQELHTRVGDMSKKYMDGPLFEFLDMDDPYMKRIRLNKEIPSINKYKSVTFSVTITDCYRVDQKYCTSLTSEPIQFVVLINDVNDFKPDIFSKDENPRIPENTEADRTVFDIYATDEDTDPINQIAKLEVIQCGHFKPCPYFRVRQDNLKCNTVAECEAIKDNVASMNQATIITTETPIDYEALAPSKDHSGTEMAITIKATNHIAIKKLSMEKIFSVMILDINEKPSLQPMRNLNVFENRPNEQVQGGCINANDPEGDPVTYTILGNGTEFFTITQYDETSEGCLKTVGSLDREADYTQKSGDQKNVINIYIQATERNTDEQLTSDPFLYEVLIADKNDNGPVIKTVERQLYSCNVLHRNQGFKMLDMKIIDPDYCPENCGKYTFDPIQNTAADGDPPLNEYQIRENSLWGIYYSADHIVEDAEMHEIPAGKHYIRISGWDTENTNIMRTDAELNICDCDSANTTEPVCTDAKPLLPPESASFPWWASLIIALVILAIIIAGLVIGKRPPQAREDEKPFLDEDDEIDNLMEYDGEMGESKKDDWYKEPRDEMRGVAVAVMPETNVYAARPDHSEILPRDRDLMEKDYLNDAKRGADNDPTAPPYDSLLTFDYEGQNSDCDLDSLCSGSDYEDQHLDQLDKEFRSIGVLFKGGPVEKPYL